MIPRRKFLRYSAVAGLLAGFGSSLPAYARPRKISRATGGPIDLYIDKLSLDVDGRKFPAQAINGTVPGPLIRLREGQEAVIRVTNRLKDERTSIHWHGLILPFRMDGVPGVSFAGIAPGETFEYRFPVRQNGTYWYHSHSAFQEQLGVYGPMIIDPAGRDPVGYDREYVVVLSDWLHGSPTQMFAKLKKQSNYSNYHRRTVGDFLRDASKEGLGNALKEREMWGRMRMDPTDIADITGYHYTFLMNGLEPASNWTGLFRAGERVRLRFINSGTLTFFDVRIPGLRMTVVQADGQNVKPVTVDEFRIGVAETYDVIVQPSDDRAYTIFAEAMDRSGFARGTLAPREGMVAPLPERRKPPIRPMADMGMAMGGMEHGGSSAMNGMPGMKGSASGGGKMGGMEHGGSSAMNGMPGMKGSASGGGKMGGMEHGGSSAMNGMPGVKGSASGGGKMGGMEHGGSSAMNGMPGVKGSASGGGKMGGMEHSGSSAMNGMPGVKGSASGGREMGGMSHGASGDAPHGESAGMKMSGTNQEGGSLMHGPDKHGPGNQAVPMAIKSRLHEPGTGLEDMPWRVLVYTDLQSLEPGYDRRKPEREIELHATGNMQRYMWSFDGQKYSESKPIEFYYGERLRFTWVNDTMMEHPLHLHGMFMELDNGQGAYKPRKHTIILKPGEKLSSEITVDAPGAWAFHCHILYHMEAGMFRVVAVVPRA